MTYLITGATGDIGSKLVELLLRRGERPRVFARDEHKARSRFGDRVDVFVGDLADPTALTAALEGVDEFFLVNSGPQIPVRDDDGAGRENRRCETSCETFLDGRRTRPQHWRRAERDEAAIRESGMPFTFVQPTGFMSNLLAWAPSIKAEGVVRASTGEGKRAFIHSDDIAAVATEALTTREHDGAALPITGPEALTLPK